MFSAKSCHSSYGGRILKALSSAGIKADGERDCSILAPSSRNTYCQDIVPMAITSAKERNAVRRKVGRKEHENIGFLRFFGKLMLV